MDIYSRGAVGPEVERIQQRLKELGHYMGPVDGIFGGGTMAAVKAFQRASGLAVDGMVGPESWERLFGGETLPAPAIAGRSLAYRSLALTAALETGAPPPDCFSGVSGDFDGQGISFGALQWCLGQNSLQPLLREMDRRHRTILEEIFDERCEELRAMLDSDLSEQLDWARAIQNARWVADVRQRKMMIATGQGIVHGSHFDLERQYGITLRPVPGL